MSKRWLFAVVTMLILLFVLPTMAQEHDAPQGDPVITLERRACFGTCPVYTIQIYADGTVVYEGINHVEITGIEGSMLDPETVTQMVAAFEDAGYFDWEDEYTQMTISDLPTTITSVTSNGQTKRIVRYDGDDSAPIALPYLENWVDIMVNSQQWTGKLPVAPAFLGQVVITLEREACFGTCPVYKLYLYEDGTVVFMGIRFVDALGVHVTQIDAMAVEMLATRMTAEGYFGWDAAYTDRLITDQATAITSLTWDGQQHQITRYDGDPNAPVGLVRDEDAIDAAVNVSQWLPE